jgi:hypothetical protein
MCTRTLFRTALALLAAHGAAHAAANDGRLVVTGINVNSLAESDRASAKTLFLQTLGEVRQGVLIDNTDSDCQAVACANQLMAANNAQKAIWLSVIKLGQTHTLSASLVKTGDSSASVRRATVPSVDELPNTADQLVRSLLSGKSVAEGGTIDNVTVAESEDAPLRRQSLSMKGFVIGPMYPIGSSYKRVTTNTYSKYHSYTNTTSSYYADTTEIKIDHPRQALNMGITWWYEFRQNLAMDVEAKIAFPSAMDFQMDVVKFFSKGDISPFVGGGMGMEYVFPDDPDPDNKMNVGPQLNAQAGIMLFRTYNVRAMFRGGYQYTFNSDGDQAVYFELGVLFAPPPARKSSGSGVTNPGLFGRLFGY